MTILAMVIHVALYFISAGYGILRTERWGPTIGNRFGWIVMEAPVFVGMALLWWFSDRAWQAVPFCFFVLFQLHYFQRSFIFPFLMKGNGRMPLSIVLMAVLFNSLNALMQGGWIFYFSPERLYSNQWFYTPQFIIGTMLFIGGMIINIHSDSIIRKLRKQGDSKHYIPQGGLFNYVSSANYLGELIEWIGFAVLTWSIPGAIFAFWTYANLAPRAHAIHKRYGQMFGKEFTQLNRKRVIPFLY